VKTLLKSALVAAAMLASAGAWAHGAAPGLGNFVGGFIHPLAEPAQVVALVALALLVGQQTFRRAEPAVWSLGLATAIGVAAAALSARWAGWGGTDALLLVFAGLTGVLVAVARPLPVPVYVGLAFMIGIGSGLESSPEGLRGGARIGFMAGALVGTLAWLGDAGLLVQACHRAWGKVVVRVVGSWMTACSVIVLALQLKR